MGFADRYIASLGASNLRDDAQHHQAEPLTAAAFAAVAVSGDLGSLLHRVKYADPLARQAFEGNPANLTQLLRLWIDEVIKRGRARRWVPENTEWDATSAQKLYRTVAEASLAHWLDSTCKCCNGTGVVDRYQCRPCAGTGQAPIEVKGAFVLERTKDMVSELQSIVDSHCVRAASKLRVAA